MRIGGGLTYIPLEVGPINSTCEPPEIEFGAIIALNTRPGDLPES